MTIIRGGIVWGLLACCTLVPSSGFADDSGIALLHQLADFSGTVPYSEVRVIVDRVQGESFVIEHNLVRVFNAAGMEVFSFGKDRDLGTIRDLAVDENGEIFLLADMRLPGASEPVPGLVRCNYRGEPQAQLTLRSLPPEFEAIDPNRVFYRDGQLVLLSTNQLLMIEVDRGGGFSSGLDLAKLLEVDPERRGDVQIAGSSLDPSGSLLLAVPVRFRVYEVTREGKVTQFGKAGSAPGLFGIVSGVAGDPHGRIFVADKLRSVVMVFDRERQFVTEFGGRGLRPDQLITPSELVLGRGDTLFVTQGRKRGVSVFAIAAAGEAKSPGAAR